jgi:hypothetical protein
VKDAFHACVCKGQRSAVSPARAGTKAAGRYSIDLAPGESRVVRARMRAGAATETPIGETAIRRVRRRLRERRASATLLRGDHASGLGPEERDVHRQALAGSSGRSSIYAFDLERWLAGDPDARRRPRASRAQPRVAASLQQRVLACRTSGNTLVRGVGPRLPLRAARAHRPGLREAAARAADA